jgi:hypothetical protein
MPNPRPTHPPADLFYFFGIKHTPCSFGAFLGVGRWALLGKDSSKTPPNFFYRNPMPHPRCRIMSKTPPKKSTKIAIPVFPRFFCFIAFYKKIDKQFFSWFLSRFRKRHKKY